MPPLLPLLLLPLLLLVVVPALGKGPPKVAGVEWTERTPAADYSWSSIAFGHNMFVAVANEYVDDPVMTSVDGLEWVSRKVESAAFSEWYRVIFGGNRFVAVGGNGIMVSDDGISWTIGNPAVDDGNWLGVAYSEEAGLYVAVGDSSTALSSPDGLEWKAHEAVAGDTWSDVVYARGMFVAVGGENGGIMISRDGATWESVADVPNGIWDSVAYGADAGVFVAIGSWGLVTSRDGLTWVNQTAPILADPSITYGGGVFAAVPGRYGMDDDDIWFITSRDGVEWFNHTGPDTLNGISFGQDRFVAVGDSVVVTSP